MNSLSLIALLACVALSMAVTCPNGDTSQCDVVKCDSGWTLGCHNGQCTCDQGTDAKSCRMQSDCSSQGDSRCDVHYHGHDYHRGRWHCIDGKCKCSWF